MTAVCLEETFNFRRFLPVPPPFVCASRRLPQVMIGDYRTTFFLDKRLGKSVRCNLNFAETFGCCLLAEGAYYFDDCFLSIGNKAV